MFVTGARYILRITAWLALFVGILLAVLTLIQTRNVLDNTVLGEQASSIVATQVLVLTGVWLFGGLLSWALLVLIAQASEDIERTADNVS